MKSKIVLIGLILVVAIGFISYYQFNKKVKSIEHQKADIELTASELMASYESDEMQANKQYLDKIILLSGVVSNVESNEERTSIFLKTENDFGNVICQLEHKPINIPKKGDRLKIKGVCSGYLMDVVIIRAVIQ